MKISKDIILILLLTYSKLSFGQINTADIYYRWGVDKPTLKQDTISLTKYSTTNISVYEVYANDSGKWGKENLVTSWDIKCDKDKITSSTITTKRPSYTYPFESLNKTTDKLSHSKNKITETIGGGGLKFKLTHYLNDSGQVIKTVCKCIECKFESRYDEIGWIEYKYTYGLLSEAIYYGDGGRIIKGFPYSKFVFYYSRDTISRPSH